MTSADYYTLKPGDQVSDTRGRYWTVTQAATATARAKAERTNYGWTEISVERTDVSDNWTKLPKLEDI